MLIDGDPQADRVLILAHGAGAGADTGFMDTVARGIATAGVYVVRFEFPYMRQIRETGRKRPPDRMPVLVDAMREVATEHAGDRALFLGGKSLGARVAATLAAELTAERAVSGVLAFGYPFHPPKKPDRLRLEPLQVLPVPGLVLQGERDPFGTPSEIESYNLPPNIERSYLTDGDHSYKPRRSAGVTEAQNLQNAATRAADFIARHAHT